MFILDEAGGYFRPFYLVVDITGILRKEFIGDQDIFIDGNRIFKQSVGHYDILSHEFDVLIYTDRSDLLSKMQDDLKPQDFGNGW